MSFIINRNLVYMACLVVWILEIMKLLDVNNVEVKNY